MDFQPSFEFGGSGDYSPSHGATSSVLSCISRRKLSVGLITVALIILGTLVLLVVPKSYTATGSLIVEAAEPEAVNLGRVLPQGPLDRDTLASEVEMLGSRQLLQQVVTELDLVSKSEFNPALQPSELHSINAAVSSAIKTWITGSQPQDTEASPEAKQIDDAINVVKRNLTVEQVGQSRIIRISYSAGDPEIASQIVNSLIRDYIAGQINVREQLGAKAHVWISQRLSDLSLRASESASAAEIYRSSHGLTRGKDASTLVQDEITQVNTALSIAQQQRDEAESALRDADSARGNHDWGHLSAVLGSQLIQKLREQESLASGHLAELSSKYGPNSPMLEPAKAQLAGIRTMIQSEIDRIAKSLADRVSVAKANEDALTARLTHLKTQIAIMDKDLVPLQKLERQAAVDRDLYMNFLNRSKETDPWLDYPAARVRALSMAVTPVRPSFPNNMLAFPLLFAVSFSIAVVIALLLENRRRGFLSMDDVDKVLGVASLGLIPMSRKRDRSKDNVFREAISLLFARITQDGDRRQSRSLLVTSAVPGEGKSTTALAIAREGASRGLRILLIDGDMRSRSLSANASRYANSPGLADVLRGQISFDQAVCQPAEFGVAFLPAGVPAGSPAHLLGSPSLRNAIQAAEKQYDLVVIDSPPVLAGADTWLIGSNAGMTLMLARWRHTPIKRTALAVRLLALSKSKLVGVALSIVNVGENARYDHGDAILFSSAMQRYYTDVPAVAFQPTRAVANAADPK